MYEMHNDITNFLNVKMIEQNIDKLITCQKRRVTQILYDAKKSFIKESIIKPFIQ